MSVSLLGWVLLGSGLGGAARFALSEWVARGLQETFPWGTFCVNVTGALAIGLWFGTGPSGGTAHALVVLGFLGSYTTVSSFALQSLLLAEESRWPAAGAYVVASAAACMLAAAIGFAISASGLGPA